MVSKILRIKTKNQDVAVIKKGNKYLCLEVSKVRNDKWITVKPHGDEEKGRHLKLEGDETPKEAMKRQWGVDIDKKNGTESKEQYRKVVISQKTKERKISDEYYTKYKTAEEKENVAREKWLEEDKKLRDFAKSQGLGLYDAEKRYPNIRDWKRLRDERDGAIAEKKKLFAEAVSNISSNIKDTLEKYSKKTENYIKNFESIPDKLKEANERIEQLRQERDSIYENKNITLGEQLRLLTENTLSLREAKDIKKQKQAEQVQENIKIINQKDTKFEVKSKTSSMQEMAQKLGNALDGFIGEGIVSEDAVVEIRKLRSGGRAHEGSGVVNITIDDDLPTAIHEYMHFIEEKNPRILINSLAFAKSRTEGEETQSLARLTGNRGYKGEYAKKDKFFDPYCGKVYNPYENHKTYEGASASEIMSMGMQRLFEAPKKFAQEDREYFNFVIANIKGDI